MTYNNAGARTFLSIVPKDEKYAHLEAADIKKVEKCLKEKTDWYDKQLNACTRMKIYENPPVLASQIRQTKDVSKTLYILNTKISFYLCVRYLL